MTEAERESIGTARAARQPAGEAHDHLRGRDPRLRRPGVPQKIDVLPGRYTTTWYHPTRIGEYHIFCDQYCGTWHSLMVGKVEVVSEDEYATGYKAASPLRGRQPGGRVAGHEGGNCS